MHVLSLQPMEKLLFWSFRPIQPIRRNVARRVWLHMIVSGSEPQSALELQFSLSEQDEFRMYLSNRHDTYENYEPLLLPLGRTLLESNLDCECAVGRTHWLKRHCCPVPIKTERLDMAVTVAEGTLIKFRFAAPSDQLFNTSGTIWPSDRGCSRMRKARRDGI
jgi:hypothetical protein